MPWLCSFGHLLKGNYLQQFFGIRNVFVIYMFQFGLSLVNTMSRLAKVIVCQIVKIPKKMETDCTVGEQY